MRLRPSTLVVAIAALVVLPPPGPVRAADPFYEDLLQAGKRALLEGKLDAAALDLEIACFGLLDEPPSLADCLSHLAVAQSRSGDVRSLETSLDRLLALEETHQGYSLATLPIETSAALEKILEDNVALERLALIDAFRPIAQRKDLEALMAAPPAQRRALLVQRLQHDPADSQALQLLAELELAAGAPAAALPHLDALVALSGGETETVCQRFRAAIEAAECARTLEDLDACPGDATQPAAAQMVLTCLLQSSDLETASTFVASLGPGARSSAKMRKLERQLERQQRDAERSAATMVAVEPSRRAAEAPVPPAEAVEAPANGQQIASTGVDAAGNAQNDTSTELSEDELKTLRRQLNKADDAQELNLVLIAAVETAEAHPESPEAQFLAAEAAYRAAQWQQAVRLFDAGGDPGVAQPLLLFYKAVALFEIGDTEAAVSYLERALPHLRKTAFVKSYAERIMAFAEGAG